MIVLSVIAPPESAPQIALPAAPPPPRLDPLDHRIVNRLREDGLTGTWELLNDLADDEPPPNRSESRRLRLVLWERLRRLLHLGVVFRHGRRPVGLNRPTPVTGNPIRRRRRRRPTARPSASIRAGSTSSAQMPVAAASPLHMALPERVEVIPVAATPRSVVGKSERVVRSNDATSEQRVPITAAEAKTRLTPDEFRLLVAMAARALGARPRPRRKRVWTGWLGRTEHLWKGRRIITPAGTVGRVVVALRGDVLVEWDDPYWIEGQRRAVHRVDQLQVLKDSAAAFLGSMKAGIRETPSSRKRESCRRNGCQPCVPGKKRGRPRTISVQA